MHRGIEYEIKRGMGLDVWIWTIHVQPTVRLGVTTGSRDRAIRDAEKAIVKWCYDHPAECGPAAA
jgi:hypothetical protein